MSGATIYWRLPNCTPESVFALEIAHDAEAPLTAGAASVQASRHDVVWERRIRVHTLVLPTSPDVGVVAASADADVVANLLAKASVEATLKAGLMRLALVYNNGASTWSLPVGTVARRRR